MGVSGMMFFIRQMVKNIMPIGTLPTEKSGE